MTSERGCLIGMVLAFALLMTGLVIIPECSSALLAASVDMELTTEEQFATYTGNGFSQVQYDGYIAVRVPSLPNGQIMDVTFHLKNEELEYEFDPSYVMITKSTGGEEIPFVLSILVDETVQAGEVTIEAYASWSYRPGLMSGNSNVSEASLFVDECKGGEIIVQDSIDIEEGNMGLLEFEVLNCGNAWMEYDLFIDGIARAGSKGIQVDADNVQIIEMYYQTSEIMELNIFVDDISQDTTLTLKFTLKDHETGDEFSSSSLIIYGSNSDDPGSPPTPANGGNTDPGTSGNEDPVDDGDIDDTSSDDPQISEEKSSSFFGIWMIIPIIAMVVGIGAYILLATRKREISG